MSRYKVVSKDGKEFKFQVGELKEAMDCRANLRQAGELEAFYDYQQSPKFGTYQ